VRRSLISIVGSTFGGSFADQPLEFAPELGRGLVATLSQHGYVAQPSNGHVDLDARQLGEVVTEAIQTAEPDDLLIVHILGHGKLHRGRVVIVGADGEAPASTSVDNWILDATGDDEDEDHERHAGGTDSKARVLFLIDVCFGGQAARQAFDNEIDDDRRRAWVIAGCLPTRSGYNGHFTEALIDVLGDLSVIDQHYSFSYVPLASVVRAVRKRVLALAEQRQSYPQQVIATRVDLGAVVDVPFFDNPAHQTSIVGSIPPELRDLVVSVDSLVDPWHFASRASGRQDHHGRIMPGTFRGRGDQLRRMTAWITGSVATPLMVVTGSPGVGKSATIGMLVCASHPQLAETTVNLWWARRAELPDAPQPNLAVVHARERSLTEILRSVARQLQLPNPGREWSAEDIREAFLRYTSPPVLVLDGLDEAINPTAVVAAANALTAIAADGRSPCRLMVGTRAGRHWPVFLPLCDEASNLGALVDLDSVDRAELRDDLVGYVDDLLRTDVEFGARSMTEARHFVAEHVADVLSAPVEPGNDPHWGEFLVAGVYVNHLIQTGTWADVAPSRSLATQVPRKLPEVLDLDLSSRMSGWSLQVLEVVAHAFGPGLSLDTIQACCARFAKDIGAKPSRAEITDALWRTRFYLRRDHEPDGTTLYRLFHQALADHLQRRTAERLGGPAAAHARILDALLESVSHQGRDAGGWDGTITAPYLLRHAADHAAACGRIDELLTDARFLVHADATYLARHLRRARTPEGRVAAAIFRNSLYHHLRLSPLARRSVLAVDATRQRQWRLRQRVIGVAGEVPTMTWWPTWSTGGQSSSLLHLLPGRSEITAVAFTEPIDGRHLAIVGAQDGGLRLWDLVDGTLRAVRATDGTPVLHAFARSTSAQLGPMMVAVNGSGTVRQWTLPESLEVSCTSLACAPSTVAAHLAVPAGPTHVLTGDVYGHLHCMTVESGFSWVSKAHAAEVTALTTTLLADGAAIAVSGDLTGEIRVWQLATGKQLFQMRGHSTWIGGIACHRLGNGTDIAVTTGGSGAVNVWDLRTGELIHRLGTGRSWTAPAACIAVPAIGADLLVLAGDGDTAEVWDLSVGQAMWTLSGHRSWLGPVSCTTLADGIAVAVTTSGDGTARMWDLQTGSARGVLTGHTDSVTISAHLRTSDGANLLVTAGLDGQTRAWELGATAGENPHRINHLDTVTSLASGQGPDNRPFVVSAGRDGAVLRWNAQTGEALGLVHSAENPVMALAAGEGADGHMIVSGDLAGIFRRSVLVADGDTFAATVDERFEPAVVAVACSSDRARPFQAALADLSGGRTHFRPGPEEDFDIRPAFGATVNALAWLKLTDGTPVIVTGAADCTVAVWDVETAERQLHMIGHLDQVTSVAGLSGPDGLIVSGGDDGVVRCWRLEDGAPLLVLSGHTSKVNSVACGSVAGGAVVAAAAGSTVRVWRTAEPDWCEVITLPEISCSVHFTSDGGLVVGYGWEVARFDPAPADQPDRATRFSP
jgi:WD40 repeat protein